MQRWSSSKRPGVEYFTWNHMSCYGTAFHKAVIDGDLAVATEILHRTPAAVHDLFSYADSPFGAQQKRTGKAIHLAASRGHVDMVDLLLASGASLSDKVCRDGKHHYDVFLAAVFAEGRLDNNLMVRKLIQLRAEVEPNSAGDWPLHLVYQQGNFKLIPLLLSITTPRQQKQLFGDKEKSPLMRGIKLGKMTTKQLAWAAPCTSTSLHIFIQHEPACIKEFLGHALLGGVNPADLAHSLEGSTIANIIRRHPEAACALLDGITCNPICPDEGWHPLPNRASFAPRSRMHRLRQFVNPKTSILVTYQQENEWTFNLKDFQAPKWHAEEIPGVTTGPPVYDVSVKVCHVPNILCPEFFAALSASVNWAESELFENPVVAASIEHVWWRGACKYDVLRVLWSLWILSLWLLEVYHCQRRDLNSPGVSVVDKMLNSLAAADGTGAIDSSDNATSLVARQLGGHHVQAVASNDTLLANEASEGQNMMPLTSSFIGAVGLVSLAHELMGFGCRTFGCSSDLLSVEHLYPLFRSCTQVLYFWTDTSRTLQQLMIFLTWCSILECFTCAETLALALLPLIRLGRSMAPPIFLTCIFFGCFMHMFQNLWDIAWSESFVKCFAMLLMSQLPADIASQSFLAAFVTYAAVLGFSIFLLNIFIGIISTAYEAEKAKSTKAFHRTRALRCRNFLLRTRFLACGLADQPHALCFSVFVITISITLQGLYLGCQIPLWLSGLQTCLHSALLLACYQSPNEFWAEEWERPQLPDRLARNNIDLEEGARVQHPRKERFLWIATRCMENHPTDQELLDFMMEPEGVPISAKNPKQWSTMKTLTALQ